MAEQEVKKEDKILTVKATKVGYFNNKRVPEGAKFQVKESELGSWMKVHSPKAAELEEEGEEEVPVKKGKSKKVEA